jgi:hypothetical protein
MTAKAPTERGFFNSREASWTVNHSARKPLKAIDDEPLPICERALLHVPC